VHDPCRDDASERDSLSNGSSCHHPSDIDERLGERDVGMPVASGCPLATSRHGTRVHESGDISSSVIGGQME
jgi:hypothetical protein